MVKIKCEKTFIHFFNHWYQMRSWHVTFQSNQRQGVHVLTNWTTVLGGLCLVLIFQDLESLSIICRLNVWPLRFHCMGYCLMLDFLKKNGKKKITPTSNFIYIAPCKTKMYSICSSIGLARSKWLLNNKVTYE